MWAASILTCKKIGLKFPFNYENKPNSKQREAVRRSVKSVLVLQPEGEDKGMKQHQQDKPEQVCLYFLPLTNFQQ